MAVVTGQEGLRRQRLAFGFGSEGQSLKILNPADVLRVQSGASEQITPMGYLAMDMGQQPAQSLITTWLEDRTQRVADR
jgi:hypothetical protein